ncbi:L-aspartate oxidase [Nocardiopsis mangrovi]|uniref:L-aspartate oxidase n=1 Tax=Nocardiopsis mangrovi TaxID=1179818 RepID=A0ABV9E1K2_9ACTN
MSATTSSPLPLRLTAPEPGWTTEADVVIVGSGVAGLSTALDYVARVPGGRAVIVTKDVLSTGSTRWAQGGVAAALGPADRPVAHMIDTLTAGDGACDPRSVHVLATEGPGAVRRLVAAGARFDLDPAGELALTREGGHRADRIAHAGGDATGAEIERALIAAVEAQPRIEVIEHALALDALLTPVAPGAPRGRVRGVTLHVMGEGRRDGVGAVLAPSVVIATGGIGQIFAATTNPPVSTGDGVALALRAGAEAQDLEFVQFHPTVLWLGADSRGQQPLVSEAVRGEGAFLVDTEGRRFMRGEHELADLAPRDIVTRAISRAMADTGAGHVLLDARHFGAEKWERRFPTILASCRAHGIDPVTRPIPVVPAAHYASGGIRTDLDGATSVPGLYAVGEAACTGVHGANRLASNSLLEGLVFAGRIARALAGRPTATGASAAGSALVRPHGLADPATAGELRAAMSRHVGVVRDGAGLAAARAALDRIAAASAAPGAAEPGIAAWEATNLLTVAAFVAAHAEARRESRGAHWRSDHPGHAPGGHAGAVGVLDPEGRVTVLPRPAAPVVRPPEHISAELAASVPEANEPTPDDSGLGTLGLVRTALDEDLRHGAGVDVTTVATIPAGQLSTADVVARADGTAAGLAVAELVFWTVAGGAVEVERRVADGDRVRRGDVLMTVTARTRDLLTAERTALNLLTHLSGIATATARWVAAVEGTGARIRDSRKTHPGLRALEKYAVRCGGGVNHRYGLADAALIKDNHVLAAGGVAEAVRAVQRAYPGLPLEVEVDRIDQIEPALKAGAQEILLDNFTVADLRRAVALVAGRARLESSGGLTLAVASEVAATGVDYLAVGALTHSSPALDIALDLRETH